MASATLIAGGIAAGGALLGGITNAFSSNASNKATLRYNKWALEQQRLWQQQDWATKSSPQAQVRNLQASGLNAGVMYGNGGAPSSDAGSIPQANPYEAQPVNYAQGIGEAAQKFMSASLDYSDLQKKTIDNAISAATAEYQIRQQKAVTESTETAAQQLKETLQSNINSAYWQAKNQEMQNYLMSQQRTNLELDADIKRFNLNNIMPAQLAQIEQDTNMRLFQMVTETKKWNLMDAQTKSTLAHIMIDQYNAVSGRINANAVTTQAAAAMKNAETNERVGDSQIILNHAKASESASNSSFTMSKAVGQNLKNELDLRTMDYVVESTKKNLQKLGKDVDTYTLRNVILPVAQTYIQGMGTMVNAGSNVLKAGIRLN